MAKKITLTRQELYEKVWTTPISKVSKELGMSDVGLGKVCNRLGIPKPGLGYWAKIAHGHNVRKKPLPVTGPGQSDVIEFTVDASADAANGVNRYEDIRSELPRIQQQEAMFLCEQSSRLKHPLIMGCRKFGGYYTQILKDGFREDVDRIQTFR